MTESQPPVETLWRTLSPEFLHDLRTPLNQILGYSEMLMEQALEEKQNGFVPDLQKIHAAARELVSLLAHGVPSLSASEATVERALPMAALSVLQTGVMVEPPDSVAVQSAILVVDDSRTNREMLSRRLERQGHATVKAESGTEALQRMRAQEFDLVLLDIMMPEMDGFAVLQTLKADATLRHLPVIMISALDELESVARCIEMGAEDYLPKPSNPILFNARISAILERKHARDRERSLFQQLQASNRRLEELEKLHTDLAAR
ncbi:MAG: putative histidine kinase [Chthonomonadales bacterium]|nr:putative histidine kinase [Chthonomonadales bacterium]